MATSESLPLRLVCEGCGTVGVYDDEEVPFQLGWDFPPRFSYCVTCPNCSSAEVMMRKGQLTQPMTIAEIAEAMIQAGHARATVETEDVKKEEEPEAPNQ